MNCRHAGKLLHAERDRPLAPEEAADLEQHLAGCAACRRTRALLEESAAIWKQGASAVAVPDPLREWQALRRRLRSGEPARRVAGGKRLAWLGGGLAAAAAALAFALLPSGRDVTGRARPIMARAESVEFADADATPVVFVDEVTGWLVVWSVAAGPNSRS